MLRLSQKIFRSCLRLLSSSEFSYLISENCVSYLPQDFSSSSDIPVFSTVFVNHVFHMQVQLYSLTMSSLPYSQQTNRHLDARLSRNENALRFKVQGHTAQHLEWNSLLQNYRRISGPTEQRQITLAHKIVYTSETTRKEIFQIYNKVGPGNSKYQGLCKRHLNLTKFRQSAVWIFYKVLDISTFSLKDESVLSSIFYPLKLHKPAQNVKVMPHSHNKAK